MRIYKRNKNGIVEVFNKEPIVSVDVLESGKIKLWLDKPINDVLFLSKEGK